MLWAIVGLICVPMVFFGVETLTNPSASGAALKVGDEEIFEPQIQQAIEMQYEQYRAMFGEDFRVDQLDRSMVRDTVIRELVADAASRQYAVDLGFGGNDKSLVDYLAAIPAFQIDGQFSAEAYRQQLRSRGFTPTSYEQLLRDAFAAEQLRRTVIDSALSVPKAALLAQRLESQRRDVASLELARAPFREGIELADAEVASYYEQNSERFRQSEMLRVDYLLLDLASLPPAADPGREFLRTLYDSELARFTLPETVTARHILIAFGDDRDAARKAAESVLAELRGGADFDALAGRMSADSDTAADGGLLGSFERGTLEPALEDALFAAPVGEVGGPVETTFGYHIYRVDAHERDQRRGFDDPEVQATLLNLYRTRDAQLRFGEMKETLERLSFERNDSLQPAAEALKLNLQQTAWFGRQGGDGIAADPRVLDAAFDPMIIEEGENSELIELSAGRVLVLRKADYQAEQIKPLEQVAAQITEQLLDQRAAERQRATLQAIADALRSGTELSELARQHPTARFREFAMIDRGWRELPAALISRAFALPRPGEDALSVGEVELADGSQALVVVRRVEDATASEPSAVKVRQLAESLAGSEYSAFRAHMEASVPVKRLDTAADGG